MAKELPSSLAISKNKKAEVHDGNSGFFIFKYECTLLEPLNTITSTIVEYSHAFS